MPRQQPPALPPSARARTSSAHATSTPESRPSRTVATSRPVTPASGAIGLPALYLPDPRTDFEARPLSAAGSLADSSRLGLPPAPEPLPYETLDWWVAKSDGRGRIPVAGLRDLEGEPLAATAEDEVIRLTPAAGGEGSGGRVVHVRRERLGLPAALLRSCGIEAPETFLVLRQEATVTVAPADALSADLAAVVTSAEQGHGTASTGSAATKGWWKVRVDRDGWLPATGLRDFGDTRFVARTHRNTILLRQVDEELPTTPTAALKGGRLSLPAPLLRRAGISAPSSLILVRSEAGLVSVFPAPLLQPALERLAIERNRLPIAAPHGSTGP